MTGETLKQKLESLGYTKAFIAEKLGVAPQNIQTWFKADDVKSGTLERLAEVLELPIAYFYGDSYNVQGNGNALATGDHSTASSSDDRLLALLMSKDTQLTMSMQQTSKAQEQITELIRMMQK
jgi:transcriptional regulator with XRE-family HTH domain